MFGLNFWLNGRADRLAGTTALGKLQTSVRDGMRTPARAGRRIIQSAYGNRRLQQPDPSHHSQPPGSGLGCPVAAVRGVAYIIELEKIDDFVVALATAESERFKLFGIPLEPAEIRLRSGCCKVGHASLHRRTSSSLKSTTGSVNCWSRRSIPVTRRSSRNSRSVATIFRRTTVRITSD